MRLAMRFVLPLLLILAAFAYAVAPLVDQLTLRWSVCDLDLHSTVIANALEDPLGRQLASGSAAGIAAFFTRVSRDGRFYAAGYCGSPDGPVLPTPSFPSEVRCNDLARWNQSEQHMLKSPQGLLHVSVKPFATAANPVGQLVLVQDMNFIVLRSEETRRYLFYFFLGLAVVVSFITVVIAQLSWRGWVAGTRALLRGEGLLHLDAPSTPQVTATVTDIKPPAPEFRPIARDLQRLIRDLDDERRTRDESQLAWTPETLRAILHNDLRGGDVIVVSNREPYLHQRQGDHVKVQRSASGLVTTLEPVMRACSGVWIATGSGSADREVLDANDRMGVPLTTPPTSCAGCG